MCKSGSVMYNQTCYKENIGCVDYNTVGCSTCDTNYRSFYLIYFLIKLDKISFRYFIWILENYK